MRTIIEETGEILVVAVPHKGPFNQIGEAFNRMGRLLEGMMAEHADKMGPGIGIYYFDTTSGPEEEWESHAGVIWNGPTDNLPEGLEIIRIPAGRRAVLHHNGPYDGIPDSWKQLHQDVVKERGETPAGGMCYEVYLNNPMNTPAEDLQTDLCQPIA